jgi:hypothetical protein
VDISRESGHVRAGKGHSAGANEALDHPDGVGIGRAQRSAGRSASLVVAQKADRPTEVEEGLPTRLRGI